MFDSANYLRAPILSIATAITLPAVLVAACPDDAPPNVKKACKKLAKAGEAAQNAWAERQRVAAQSPAIDGPAIDVEADASWSALRMRLEAYALLPVKRFPHAARATDLIALLFGAGGLSFLKEKYPAQFAAMDTLLQRIDAEGLADDIDELAGPMFLRQIRAVHPRYDAMVKAMLQREDANGDSLLDHVRAVQRAIVDYATKVVATTDEDDPATIERARVALRALDTMRASQTRGGGTDDGVEPSPPAEPPKPA
jgi:hypothetical protein